MSASINSVSIVSMSEIGSTVAGDVNHIGILKAANDLHDRVDLANVAEKFVAQPFAVAGPFDDPGDVDQLQRGRNDFLGDDVPGDPRQTFVGNIHDPFVRLNRAKRIIFTLRRL